MSIDETSWKDLTENQKEQLVAQYIKQKEHENLYWKEHSSEQKSELYKIIDELAQSHCSIANEYNFILYKWYFILNVGGLAGTITLFSKFHDKSIVILWIILLIIFLIGTLSIIFANKLEIDRFLKLRENVFNEFKYFKENTYDRSHLMKKIECESYPDYLISILEWGSIICFLLGIIIGVAHFLPGF